jgi:hypothetical protein
MEMRSTSICFSKNKAKKERDTIKEKVIQVNELEKTINKEPTDEILEQYNESKKYIEQYNKEQANGARIRSKVNWAEFGEKNTKFFLNLEKRNYKLKCITKLTDEKGTEISEPQEILTYEENFYKQLYTKKPDSTPQVESNLNKEFFNDETIPKISDEEKQTCEKPITLEEMGIALKELKNGKSPGSDGFTADFYKFFWKMLKPTILDSLRYAQEQEYLSIDQRRGIINLIPKKDKDPRLLKNWRPISLLNTDYKIITKILANRI